MTSESCVSVVVVARQFDVARVFVQGRTSVQGQPPRGVVGTRTSTALELEAYVGAGVGVWRDGDAEGMR